MANITKAERAKREAEKEAQIRAEIEAKIRAEYEEKLSEIKEEPKSTAKRIQRAAMIPLNTIVPVVCNIIGGATYISKRNAGYMIEWDDIGYVEYMELGELSSMRNTDRRFFEDNWIVIEDTDEYTSLQIYDFLKVSKYYEGVLNPENLDEIFTYSKSKIVKVCSTFSKGMKETIAVRAKQKLDDGTLDKNIVDTLEDVLGIQFTF